MQYWFRNFQLKILICQFIGTLGSAFLPSPPLCAALPGHLLSKCHHSDRRSQVLTIHRAPGRDLLTLVMLVLNLFLEIIWKFTCILHHSSTLKCCRMLKFACCTQSILCLLKPWRCMEPGHQQLELSGNIQVSAPQGITHWQLVVLC